MNYTGSQSGERTRERAWLAFNAVCIAAGMVGTGLRDSSLAAGVVGLAGSHLPVLLGAWASARRLRRRGPVLPVAAVDLVLAGQIYFTSVIVTGMCLGILGWLTPRATSAALAVASAVLLIWGGSTWRIRQPILRGSLLSRSLTAALLMVVSLVAFKAVTDPKYVYDVLTYHLFFPARWVQDGRLSIVPTWCGGPIPDYAPTATEVYYAMLMLPIGGDQAARSGQFPFWLLLICAVWALAAELGLRRSYRALAALVVALIPGIATQAATAMVDVALAAQLVCTALYSLRIARRREQADLIGLLLTVGLLMGTKYLSLTFLLALSPLILWAAWRNWTGVPRSRGIGVWLALAAALVVGPSWYVRNWLVTGNPLYPMEVRVAGMPIFDGAFGREAMENSLMNARRSGGIMGLPRVLWQGIEWQNEGFVHSHPLTWRKWCAAAAMGLTSSLFLFSWALAILDFQRKPHVLIFLASSGASLFAFWFLLPFQDHRFSWGPVVLCVIGALIFFGRTHRPPIIAVMLIAPMLLICVGGDWSDWLSKEVVVGDPRAAQFDHFGGPNDVRAETWQYVDHSVHGRTIAYVGNNIPYFLMGRRFENRVLYVPARKPAQGRFHDFARQPPSPHMARPSTAEPTPDRWIMDPQAWVENLKALGVDYVAVDSVLVSPMLTLNIRHDENGFPIEKRWLDALCDQGVAERVAVADKGNNQAPVLYRVHPKGDGSLAQFPVVVQEEVDAIDQMRREGFDLDEKIPGYAMARSVIERHGLGPP